MESKYCDSLLEVLLVRGAADLEFAMEFRCPRTLELWRSFKNILTPHARIDLRDGVYTVSKDKNTIAYWPFFN